MKTLEERMADYSAYHRDTRNRLTHVIGVPLVVFSVLVALTWFPFRDTSIQISAATLFYVGVVIYYFLLDVPLAILQLPITFAMLLLAEYVGNLEYSQSMRWFLICFFGGWTFQILGHVFEGRRPALLDNFSQIFNAPLFLICEGLFLLGRRTDLRDRILVRVRNQNVP